MRGQRHWRHIKRQASILGLSHCTCLLTTAFSKWAQLVQAQQHARQRAQHAQHSMDSFHLRRILLAWYYCTHNAKLAQLHSQLQHSHGRQADLQQQADTAQHALDELRLDRAELHRRLERVADQAKLQVAQLAVANTQMQALQQREQEHQHLQMECQRLEATVTALQHRSEQQSGEADRRLADVKVELEASKEAAAWVEGRQQEMQRRCVSLQRHLGKRKAAMQACFRLLQTAGHR